MEQKEFEFSGLRLNGIMMLVLNLLSYIIGIALIVFAATTLYDDAMGLVITLGALLIFVNFFISCGFVMIEPGEARVMMFFGKYRGTYTTPGYS